MAGEIYLRSGIVRQWGPGQSAITFANLDGNNAGTQGAKVTLDEATNLWAQQLRFWLTITFNVAPNEGDQMDILWAESSSATAGTDNPQGITGTGGQFDDSAEQQQLTWVGQIYLDAVVGPVKLMGPILKPLALHGCPVLVLRSTTATVTTETGQLLELRSAYEQVQS